jgi:hypothetical protein
MIDTHSTIRYTEMIDQAMRGVIRSVLRQVERHGLPAEHHFYITFLTNHPNVSISETLKARYQHEMTIVLQHQFWDFKVEDAYFTVTLSFAGVPERLVVPFSALTAFADPSVKFGMQFQKLEALPAANSSNSNLTDMPKPMAYENVMVMEDDLLGAAEPATAEIISLDAFRKK